MAVTIKQTEAIPASYPIVSGLSTEAQALDASALWQRIEAFTAWRWTAREVVWVIEGPGEWVPPLAPPTVSEIEVWDDAWTTTTAGASPLGGYVFDGDGPYRVTATVGGGDVPAGVSEAFRRLAEYLAASVAPAGATSYSLNLGQISESIEISASHTAKALHNSGAADLLRPYRRV
jgi:hypothetical protein